LRKKSFARTGGTDHQDITLLELNFVFVDIQLNALVMIVNGHREDFFRPILTDYVLVKDLLDSSGLRNLGGPCRPLPLILLGNDVIAELYAFIADINRRTGNQFFDFILTFSTK